MKLKATSMIASVGAAMALATPAQASTYHLCPRFDTSIWKDTFGYYHRLQNIHANFSCAEFKRLIRSQFGGEVGDEVTPFDGEHWLGDNHNAYYANPSTSNTHGLNLDYEKGLVVMAVDPNHAFSPIPGGPRVVFDSLYLRTCTFPKGFPIDYYNKRTCRPIYPSTYRTVHLRFKRYGT
jgi:hypothetical protein